MSTITIPDPAEVQRQVAAEFPDSVMNAAHFSNAGRGSAWVLTVTRVNTSFSGRGESPEEALVNLRAKIAAYDPLAEARKQLEAAGYAVISPDPA